MSSASVSDNQIKKNRQFFRASFDLIAASTAIGCDSDTHNPEDNPDILLTNGQMKYVLAEMANLLQNIRVHSIQGHHRLN